MPTGLKRTLRDWEHLARTDPLWAIVTDPAKKGNRWNRADFFRGGEAVVDADLHAILQHAPGLRHGRAVDFGCGVGRLTQALARRFELVVGIDISEEMVRLAREYNECGDRVRFVRNVRPDLRQIETGKYDLVYTIITLQHMRPAAAKSYLQEFGRVVAPGGVVFFQLPCEGPPPPARRNWTLWPDTLLRRLWRDGKQWWERRGRRDMEMYATPIPEVERAVANAGLSLLAVIDYPATGPSYRSVAYICRKDG